MYMMTFLLQQEQGSYVGEVVKAMDKKKVLVKVHPEGKFVVDIDKNIDINDVTPNCRVALRNDSYTLHKILPNKVCYQYINQPTDQSTDRTDNK